MWVCVNEFVIIVKVCLTQTVSVGLVELMLQYGYNIQSKAAHFNKCVAVSDPQCAQSSYLLHRSS